MEFEDKFQREGYGLDKKITIIEATLGKLRFYNWASQDEIVFLGRKNDVPVLIEINKKNIVKNGEYYQFEEPYGVEEVIPLFRPSLNRKLEEVEI